MANKTVPVTDEMVNRFLSWSLPDTFAPDHYISFDRERAERSRDETNGLSWPIGTNLLDAMQARQMLEYVLTAAPVAQANEKAEKDEAYRQRNHLVAALARLFPSGIRRTNIEGWSDDWHGCCFIDLPSGQISYHYHDSHAHLFADLPQYSKPWDGHDKETVHQRLAAITGKPAAQAEPAAPAVPVGKSAAQSLADQPCCEPAAPDLMSDPIGECSVCGRKAWVQSDLGNSCDFPQPNGARCKGIMRPYAQRNAAPEGETPLDLTARRLQSWVWNCRNDSMYREKELMTDAANRISELERRIREMTPSEEAVSLARYAVSGKMLARDDGVMLARAILDLHAKAKEG